MPRRHVTDADHGHIANLIIGNKPSDIFVIPGIPVEEVYCDKSARWLDLVDELPLGGDIGAQRFFRQDMLVSRQGSPDLLRPCIGESERPTASMLGSAKMGSGAS